ncbi:FAD-dependent monooxygenase [Kocuria sp. CPCC 205300]|uniref:FAD-dependent monooxygenase n=1 Tax=Kocuria sabuli TaxID=3071448 RepID=UPI0036D91186
MNDVAAETTEVLVVGAGPTGLTLGCDLRRRGIGCRVIDRVAEHHGSSRGKGIQPRTLEVLADLGAIEPIMAQGWSRNIRVRWHVSGKLLADLHLPGRDPLPEVPYPNPVLIPQWRTEQILRARLEDLGGSVELGQELQHLTQDESGVTATIRDTPTGRTRTIRSRYLIGCDGGHSRVRQLLGTTLIGDTHTEHFAFGDVEISGLDPEAAHVWFDADRYVAASPFRGQRAWQVQASVLPDEHGQVEPAGLEFFQRMLRERTGRTDIHLSHPTWLSNFVSNVRMVEHYRVGRAFLAGDAAHVHSPAGGQGMNTGIQDAYNLSWKLALVLREKSGDQLLDTHEEERRPVARAVLKGSDAGHTAVFSAHPVMTVVRERLLMPLLRLPRIQQVLLAAGNQLDISYRHCSLAVDVSSASSAPQARPGRWRRFGRGPRAGDRAPDALLNTPGRTEQRRLFDHLHGPHFTVVLFDTGVDTRAASQHMIALADRLDQLYGSDVATHLVLPDADGSAAADLHHTVLLDPTLEASHRYGVNRQAIYLIRSDGYIGLRTPHLDEHALTDYLDTLLRPSRLAPD